MVTNFGGQQMVNVRHIGPNIEDNFRTVYLTSFIGSESLRNYIRMLIYQFTV